MADECFYHEGRAATDRCHQCGRAVCAECSRKTENGVVCSDECAAGWAAVARRSEELAARAAPRRRISAGAIVKVVIILALGVLAWRFLPRFLPR